MRWLYDSKNKTIRELKTDTEWIQLADYESRLLEVLSNNSMNTRKEICQYIYGCDDLKITNDSLYLTKNRLLQKVKLDIKSFHGVRMFIAR